MNNTRLIITIFSNIIWEALIAGAVIWGLPLLGVKIPIWAVALIMIAFAVYAYYMYQMGNRILGKKAIPGSTDMIGVKGKVVKRLAPVGYISVEGELWEATTQSETIEPNKEVVVIGQKGLKLLVKTS